MRFFLEWVKSINESITFSVKGFQAKTVPNLFYLGYDINSKLGRTFGDKYYEGFPHNRFDIDGTDTDLTEGIMNFYAGGLSEDMLQKILKAIPYFVEERGGKVTGPMKLDTSRMFKMPVYRIPTALTNNNENKPPELNLANGNAEVLVQDILQISQDGEYYAGSIDVRELMMKLSMVSDFTKGMSLRANSVEKGEKGASIYNMGLSEDQINRYLEILEQMAKWAMEHNYDQIQWA